MLGKLNDHESPISRVALAQDVACFFQIVDDEGEIAAAAEKLLGQLALAKRSDVKQRFEHTELSDSQAGGQNGVNPGRNSLTSTLELYKGVEGVDFFDRTSVSSSHGGSVLPADATMSKQ